MQFDCICDFCNYFCNIVAFRVERIIRYLAFVVLLTGLQVQAQQVNDTCNHQLSGVVLDSETKEPIPFAQVKVQGENKGAVSTADGTFTIKGLCSDEYTLIISCIGYSGATEHQHTEAEHAHFYLKQSVEQLNEVTISVQKNKEQGTESISQSTLNIKQFNEIPTQSLAAAISDVDGVNMASTGSNVQIPVIHGLYGNRVLILNNGLKHGFQNWSSDHAPEIDVLSANNITVVKGSAGVRYGPEALGGAVVVEGNPMYFNETFQVKLGSGYETNGRGYFGSAQVSHGLKNLSYSVGGKYARTGDRHAPDYSLTNSGKEEQTFNAGIRYKFKQINVKLYYSYINQNLALLRSSVAESGNLFAQSIESDEPLFIRSFSYDINEPNQLTQHHLGKAEVNWFSSFGKWTFRVGQQFNSRQEYDVRRNADRPIIDLNLATSDYQLEWNHPEWKEFHGEMGVNLFTQNNDNNPGTGTTPFIPNYNTLRYSGFIIEKLFVGQNTFEIGTRIDYENNNVRGRETNQDLYTDSYEFTNVTASIGWIRILTDYSTFRSNFGTAWRTPNMAELYSFGQHGFKTTYGLLRYYTDDNGNLSTDRVIELDESNVTSENGFKWINEWNRQKGTHDLTVTAYAHLIQNYIYSRPIGVYGTVRGPMPVFIVDQTDAAFIGADVTWKKKWTKALNGTFGFSYLWSENIQDDEPLINQPPIKTSYKLSYKAPDLWKFKETKLFVKPSYTFQQFQAPRTISPSNIIDGTVAVNPDSEIFDFKDAPDGYFLVDLGINFKLTDFQFGFTVQNLFNTSYRDYLNQMRYFADNPGRNFLFTINYTIQSKS